MSALQQFNWVDIFVVIIVIRVCYVSLRAGFPIELFKLLGVILAIYLSCHYYVLAANFLGACIPNPPELAKFFVFLSFTALAALGYLIFMGLRMLFYRFIKMEAAPKLNKWGGFAIGLFRAVLTAGLIISILVVSPAGYLKHSVQYAYSGRQLFKTAADTYDFLWHRIISKFSPNEKFNSAIPNLQIELSRNE